MYLTRRTHSPLAGPRRELAVVLTVMALAFAVISVYVLCSVHLGEQAHGADHSHGAAAQISEQRATAPEGAVVTIAAAPLSADPHCSDDGTVAAQSDPVRPAPQAPVVVSDLAAQWFVPDMASRTTQLPSDVVAPAAPSLHALGICRT